MKQAAKIKEKNVSRIIQDSKFMAQYAKLLLPVFAI